MDSIGARWEEEAEKPTTSRGYEVVNRAGVSDYQGWGCFLLRHESGKWATLGWNYGSCSGCDQYEDMARYDYSKTGYTLTPESEKAIDKDFGSLIEEHDSMESALLAFASKKGW